MTHVNTNKSSDYTFILFLTDIFPHRYPLEVDYRKHIFVIYK